MKVKAGNLVLNETWEAQLAHDCALLVANNFSERLKDYSGKDREKLVEDRNLCVAFLTLYDKMKKDFDFDDAKDD